MADARAHATTGPVVPDPNEYDWNARYDAAWPPTDAVVPRPTLSDSKALEAAAIRRAAEETGT